MTGALATGLGLALLASCALNGSYLLQHAGSHSAPAIELTRLGDALRGLLRARLWLAGAVAGIAGMALHIAALSSAPLSLVQAFSAGGLAMLAPAAALTLRVRMDRGEKRAVALTALALAALGIGAVTSGSTAIPTTPLIAFVLLGTLLAVALVLRWPRRALALSAAGGLLYGVGDATMKAATLPGGLHSAWPLVVAVVSVAAFFCFQRALQMGPVVPVVALMTVATNAVAITAGLLAFGEPLGATPALAAVHAAAFAVAGFGAWRLSVAQARLTTTGEDQS